MTGTMREWSTLVLLLHAAVLLVFACYFVRSSLLLLFAATEPWAVPPLPPLHVRLHFYDESDAAPASLRAALARELRRQLVAVGTTLSDPTCTAASWRVKLAGRALSSGAVAPLSRRRHLNVAFARLSGHADAEDVMLHVRVDSGDTAGVAWQRLLNNSHVIGALASALHVEAVERPCTLSHDSSVWRPPGRISLLLLQQRAEVAEAARQARSARLVSLAECVEAFVERCWPHLPPPVHSDVAHYAAHYAAPPSEREPPPSPGSSGGANGGRLDHAASHAPPPSPPLTAARATDLLHACIVGGVHCGVPLSLAAEPPLRLLLYAHAFDERPARIAQHGELPPPLRAHGGGVVLPAIGGLLPWTDAHAHATDDDADGAAGAGTSDADGGTDADASAADGAAAAELRGRALSNRMLEQLRLLIGLEATPAPRLGPFLPSQGKSEGTLRPPSRSRSPSSSPPPPAGIHLLEAASLQLGCAHAHLARTATELRALSRLDASDASHPDIAAFDASARTHAARSVQALGRGDYSAACAAAALASRGATRAARHPRLGYGTDLNAEVQSALSTWAPLFFPIATSVGSALADEVRKRASGAAVDDDYFLRDSPQ